MPTLRTESPWVALAGMGGTPTSLGRGTSAEEVDSFSGPVVSAKALLALVGWRASRDGRDDPPASAVLVRPAFGAAGPADRGDRPLGSAAPGQPGRGDRA